MTREMMEFNTVEQVVGFIALAILLFLVLLASAPPGRRYK